MRHLGASMFRARDFPTASLEPRLSALIPMSLEGVTEACISIDPGNVVLLLGPA